MGGQDPIVRKINQFGISTCAASVLSLPIAIAHPSGLGRFSVAWSDALSSSVSSGQLFFLWTSSCALLFLQMMTSYIVLSCIEPLSHSVLNSVKRVLVIVSSVVFFGNAVSWKEVVGTTMAVGGVFLFSLAKHRFADRFRYEIVPQEVPQTDSK